MIDHTRKAGIELNGADIRGMSGWHFGPFHAGRTEMRLPDGTITISWGFMIYLPFDFCVNCAFQRHIS